MPADTDNPSYRVGEGRRGSKRNVQENPRSSQDVKNEDICHGPRINAVKKTEINELS